MKSKTKTPNGAIGINLQDVNPVLPPDNEHSGAATIALARAVQSLADAISASARALEEAARHSQKAGVYIDHCDISSMENH